MKLLSLQKLFFMLITMCLCTLVQAQPANDDCSSPTLLTVGTDASTCISVTGDTRGTVDATTVTGPAVCSGTWFSDDVWYSFELGATIPSRSITVEVKLDPSSGTDMIEQGIAIYTDCEADSEPLLCFTNEPGRRTLDIPVACLEPNTTMLIRIWSAPEPFENAGTFSICAYESENSTGPRVIYEETFDEGFNGWESISQNQSFNINTGEMEDNNWMWSNNGCFTNFGTAEADMDCLIKEETACQDIEDGAVGVTAGFFQTEWDADGSNIGEPPYPNVSTYLLSPPIDLSKENCVILTWIESARFLNGGATINTLGSYVQYSLDNGETWINPSQSIGSPDVSRNYGGEYETNGFPTNSFERSVPLIGAEGNTNVRIRFGFDGDFYFWLVDDIRLIEGSAADGVAQSNFFARAPINPMSIHMIDSYDFLIDIANLSCQDLTNANVNMTITNAAGAEVHNVNLSYGTIMADSLAENQLFGQPFTPPAIVDEYTGTYTLSADVDDNPNNNVRTFTASVVDETVFRKENGTPTGQLGPNPAVFWNEGEAYTWELGNIFFAPKDTAVTGEALRFTEISFQIGNPTLIVNDLLRVWLYEISDNDFDNIISKDDDTELIRVGISEYIVTGTENGLITVPLDKFSVGGSLNIKANTHYMATIETTTEIVRDEAMALANDDTYDYSAAIFAAQQTGLASGNLTDMRYDHCFAISKENYFRIGPGNTGDNTTGNFGSNFTPVVRLGYELIPTVATVEINKAIKIAISPNPTSAYVTVNLSVEEATDMEISIIDLTGSVISVRSFNGVTDLREEFDVSKLAHGVYMVHINTTDGVRTEKLVISK